MEDPTQIAAQTFFLRFGSNESIFAPFKIHLFVSHRNRRLTCMRD